MGMRIVIDGRLWGIEHRGIGRYVDELLKELARADQNNEYAVLCNPKKFRYLAAPGENFRLVPANCGVYSPCEQVKLPKLIKSLKPGLVHIPHFNVPLRVKEPFVVTIHDLILHHAPHERATTLPLPLYWLKVLAYRTVMSRVVSRARRIITPSVSVAEDIALHYPKASPKLCPVLLAPPVAAEPARLKLPENYLLCVGAAYPHKNLELIIRALPHLVGQVPNLKLVVVGKRDFFMRRFERFVLDQGLYHNVRFWGEASEAELAALYRGAACYVLPSLYEGFGLGAVEALQHKIPVVASDIPVLREVLQAAAIYFDPQSELACAQAIREAREPATKLALRQAGHQVLRALSWARVARETLAIYQAALS